MLKIESEKNNDENVFKASHEAVIFQVLVVLHWALNFTVDEYEKLWESAMESHYV